MSTDSSLSYTLLHVVQARTVTPHLRRLTLGGDGLEGFRSVAPDQQIRLFFARDGGVPVVPPAPSDGDVATWHQRYRAIPEPERPWMRAYSVRRHLPHRRELEVDFVLHGTDGGAGPASRWAARAQPGDAVGMLGPAVSHLRTPAAGASKLFVGDETALPAISAWLEAMDSGERALVLVEVADVGEEQRLNTRGDVEVRWLHRDGTPPGHATLLLDAVREAKFPTDGLFAWVAGEAGMVRAVRRHLAGERGADKRSIAFTGYWRLRLTQDDAPTADDEADHAEVMAELAEVPPENT